MTEFIFISQKNRVRYLRIIEPMGNLLARIGVHPHVLSVAGLILSIMAGLVYSTGTFFWAAWVVALAGTCDALDGVLARQTNKNSTFGAFFDSALDRYSDVFILVGLAWYFAGGPILLESHEQDIASFQSPWAVVCIIMAIAGSFMVSYTRARAGALGLDCRVGLMQRPERFTLLIIGSLLGAIPVIGMILIKSTLLVLALLSNFTAIQRIIYVRNQLLRENEVQ